MLGYRRKSYKIAFRLVHELAADLEKLEVLLELQELLVSEITLAEQKIRALKSEILPIPLRKNPEKQRYSEYLERRVGRFQCLRYIWKGFGDAIAFIYCDTFSLKHTLYNVDNYNPKQESGFISGKQGFYSEFAVVKDCIAIGIPSLLVDLTNTIRYGDICIMIGPDPFLVEVKSSRKLSSRSKKQVRKLKRIHDFYEKDIAQNFRGIQQIRRVEHREDPNNYMYEFNDCIRIAYIEGHCISQPEPGMFIIAIKRYDLPFERIMQNVKVRRPWIFYLNVLKSNQNWAPYIPFTLSIKSENALYDFIRGALHIIVVLDFEIISERFAASGYRVELRLHDQDHPVRIARDGLEAYADVSSHILTRSALEFLSPAWIIASCIEGFESNLQSPDAGADH